LSHPQNDNRIIGKKLSLQTFLHDNWFGKTGEIYLVNQEGMFLTEPRHIKELIGKGIIEDTGIMKLKMSDGALRNIRLGESGVATWTSYRRCKTLGAYLSMPDRGWTLVGKIDEKEVLHPIYKQLAMMAGGTMLFILLIMFLGTLITNQIKRPVEWLIKQSELIRQGNMKQWSMASTPTIYPTNLASCAKFSSI